MNCIDCEKLIREENDEVIVSCPHCGRRQTRKGRKVHTLEETKSMDCPYPPETDL